jgi:hypothetical protein
MTKLETMTSLKQFLAFRAQHLPQISIDFHCILRSLIDHLDPASNVVWWNGLRKQVGGLHDGLQRVAEIMFHGAAFLR